MEDQAPKKLREAIIQRIKKRGMIPFEEFMDLALYHPRWGYYSGVREAIGKKGDYVTSPHIHPIFGTLIARQLCQMWEVLGCPRPFTLVEMGAGRGLLCHDILKELEKNRGDLFQSLRVVLVEWNPIRVKRQKELLDPYMAQGKLRWRAPHQPLSDPPGFTGCLLSNELIDSFPVHRVLWKDGVLKEIFVGIQKGRLVERICPCSTDRLQSYIKEQGIRLVDGQRTEINLRAKEWLQQIERQMERGFILTIDFGYLADEYYAPYRMDGTLLCHYRHQIVENPFIRIGQQDITAHVNFSALIQWGLERGLEFTGFVPQYRFFLSLGLMNELAALEKGKDKTPQKNSLIEHYKEKWGMR